ncbi:MOSC domain-containing protein [Lunatimonas salinarum]|uniref:MOSC domain-containing protein n=1 Tax=Lunatimonas salinarum TaxID=1774590 RepID=UPI001ADF0200|nr:MOSC N-terminal beta barrel domain-containing protein [Lunatimonas salinarum]
MKLKDIYSYPIKSLGGIRHARSEVLPIGLANDRRWMLVDKAGNFLTQRTIPKMCMLEVQIQGPGHLLVKEKGIQGEEIEIRLATDVGKTKQVTVWGDKLPATTFNDSINGWFTSRLNTPCELVYMESEQSRQLSGIPEPSFVSFADSLPILLTSQSSLDELNRRLNEPIPMDRFRPNLVIEGASPFEEDGWDRIRLGTAILKVVKPCARCVVTTIDQKTGKKSPEPLATLAKFRRKGNDTFFGQNLMVEQAGHIECGGPVELLERKWVS